MKKVKEIFKKNYKFMIGVVLGLILASPIVQAANYLFASNQVSYDNSSSGLTSDNVKDALDELYDMTSGVKVFAKYLKSLSASDTVITDDGTADHNMRYTGKSPNNYVTFNGDSWRVIGVFNNIDNGTGKKEARVKIIKASQTYYSGSVTNVWKTSPLTATLQGLPFISNSMIEDAIWNLGTANYAQLTAQDAYLKERGTTVVSGNDPTWTGKVGLMYPSDYGFASSGCKDGSYILYNYSSCKSTNWLSPAACENDYLMSPVSGNSLHYISHYGGVYPNITTSTSSYSSSIEAVPLYVCGGGDDDDYRPVVYLKASVTCTNCSDSDAGTSGNPFQISLN